ncbi:MAG: HupE/UreJ family protein, partial [Verrucomicrobiaceae bacterium]
LFGLIHGMGFAEVFANAGLRGRGLVEALLSFNVGVELGQLSVIALAFTVVGWFRHDPRYRQWVVVPASVAIGALALFWTVERTIG